MAVESIRNIAIHSDDAFEAWGYAHQLSLFLQEAYRGAAEIQVLSDALKVIQAKFPECFVRDTVKDTPPILSAVLN